MRLSTPRSDSLHRAAMLSLAAIVLLLANRALHRSGSDFAVFHAAGARFLAGTPLYDPGQETPYRYAPGVAALFAPLAGLPLPVARSWWIALTAVLVLLVAFVAARRVRDRAPLAVPVAWLCLAQPLAQELAHGQVDVLVLALALAAFAADDADWPVLAGVLVAAAAGLKVAPAVLAADWVLRRRWRALGGCILGAFLGGLALAPRYGLAGAWNEHLSWVRSQAADAGAMIGTVANQSVWAWSRTVGLGAAGGALVVAALLAFALTDRAVARRREVLLAMVPLVSAYGWPQLFVVAVPLLASTIARRGRTAWVAGAAAAGVTLLSYDVAGPRIEGWAQEHRVMGALLLISIAAGRLATPAVRSDAWARSNTNTERAADPRTGNVP